MKSELRILHVEDDLHDASLIQGMLQTAGFTCHTTRVQTQSDFVQQLDRGGVDLILSDFSLPKFDGLSALEIARAKCPDVPFILVSGTMGEEFGIESLKSGATDYVLKERLSRLAPAVRRALHEVEERAEHRRLEARFVEAHKMEVIGQIAEGAAHDFNNLLSVIMGYSEFITSELRPDDPLRKYAEQIFEAAKRAAGLTRQLLFFSGKQMAQSVVLDLNAVLTDLGPTLRRLIDENIEMTLVPGNQTGRVHADSNYVGQLLMNLVVNARDAMRNGGKLTIATSNVTLDENYVCTHVGAFPGDHVMLSVSDTGSGMTDEVKAHIFEPFFTTKPKGQGIGLGLAICQTIVHQCGGHIEVSSEVGEGTTFKIYFPRAEPPTPVGLKPVRAWTLPRSTETSLVVKD